MKIGITGAHGVIGSALTRLWCQEHDLIALGDETDLRAKGEWMARIAAAETIVHLAVRYDPEHALESLAESIAMTVNVVSAATWVGRIVYASSMWVNHGQTSLGSTGNYYVSIKRAGEAVVQGWSDVTRRPAVSLRLGRYGSPAGTIPIEHEVLRLDLVALKWWFDKAITYDEPVHRIWQATGRLG